MRVELDLTKIKIEDLEAAYKDISCGEINEAEALSEILDKYIGSGWGICIPYLKMVYSFRLGVMLSKREEREKKKSKGGKYGKNNIKL